MEILEIKSRWWTCFDASPQIFDGDRINDRRWCMVQGLPGFAEALEKLGQVANSGDLKSVMSTLDHWEEEHRQTIRALSLEINCYKLIETHFYHLRRYACLKNHLTISTWMAQAEILASRIFARFVKSIQVEAQWVSLPSLVAGEEDLLDDQILHFALKTQPPFEGKLVVTQQSLCRMPDGSVGYFPDQISELVRTQFSAASRDENQIAAGEEARFLVNGIRNNPAKTIPTSNNTLLLRLSLPM